MWLHARDSWGYSGMHGTCCHKPAPQRTRRLPSDYSHYHHGAQSGTCLANACRDGGCMRVWLWSVPARASRALVLGVQYVIKPCSRCAMLPQLIVLSCGHAKNMLHSTDTSSWGSLPSF